tara:strand:+ start:645 stop:827 length:183 start_codon:yes stop_codon:yes gene_type:complete
MRNKNTCIRLVEKLDGDFKTLLFILSRPNADIKDFRDVIKRLQDTSSNLMRFIEREEETL